MNATSPADLGYRWPAEWEAHAATWFSWPHNPETWPGCLARAERAFVAMVRALHAHEMVCINVQDEAMEARVRALLLQGGVDVERSVRCFQIPTDDAWVRDHGPIFVVRQKDGRRERALLDFGFNAWGGKYPPWQRDDAVPQQMAEQLGLPRFPLPWILEGGSIDGNGRGLVLTTESCLLHPNRGAGRTREMLAAMLERTLGAKRVLWLAGGIEGDDTDGHIDDVARFVDASTVVAVLEEDAASPHAAILQENARRLRRMRDLDDKPLRVVPLPMPQPRVVAGQQCPASYANFYIGNGSVLVPTFEAPSDERALAILRELFTGRDVVGIDSRDLVVGLGAVHCLTQQEPL